jgi:type II secretory pathway pseudopilin PulG
LRKRLIIKMASMDLRPSTLAGKVPFVVLIIGSLAVGLGITLWLSTDAAERSYQLGNISEQNRAMLQQKEALERDVREERSAPALAEAARDLGMIPSKDTAHLVQDPTGNWVVVGSPKPAEGLPPPPLNTKLPEERPAPPPAPPTQQLEVPLRVPPGIGGPTSPGIPGSPAPGPEVLLRGPDGGMTPGTQHLTTATGPTPPGSPDVAPTGPRPGPPPDIAVAGPPSARAASPEAGPERFNEQFNSPVTTATPGAAR